MKQASLSKTKRRIKVYFDLESDENGYPPAQNEFLWCIPTDQGTYIVDNVPFFVRDISLGDEISAGKIGKTLQFSRLLHQSKNSTIRVLLKKEGLAEMIREKLDNLGCGTELMDELSLLSVTMPPDARVTETLSFLDSEAEQGNIGIEESAVRYQNLH
ncbi:MAG: DUF4265 domain-containing protein [Acidobacteriia bacterium]|nr:DUF4265 domain-containing protein [Terriglobia bacterium]